MKRSVIGSTARQLEILQIANGAKVRQNGHVEECLMERRPSAERELDGQGRNRAVSCALVNVPFWRGVLTSSSSAEVGFSVSERRKRWQR